jgi:hypothetical protein
MCRFSKLPSLSCQLSSIWCSISKLNATGGEWRGITIWRAVGVGGALMRVERIYVDSTVIWGHDGADAKDRVAVDGSSEERLMAGAASEGKLRLFLPGQRHSFLHMQGKKFAIRWQRIRRRFIIHYIKDNQISTLYSDLDTVEVLISYVSL